MRSFILAASSMIIALVLLVAYVAQIQTMRQFEHGVIVQARIAARTSHSLWLDYRGPDGKPLSNIASEPLSAERLATFETGMQIEARYLATIPTRVLPSSALVDLRPSASLLVIAACFVGLSGWIASEAWRARCRRALHRAPLAVLRTALRQGFTLQLWSGTLLMSFGSFVIWLLWSGADQSSDLGPPGQVLLVSLALISLSVGGLCLVRAWGLRHPDRSWLLATLREQPQEIAWVYLELIPIRRTTWRSHAQVWIWFASGRSYVLPSSPEDGPAVVAAISAYAPHAQVGYDPATEQIYRADPTAFRPHS